MEDFENYIYLTRGCVLPINEESKNTCNHTSCDILHSFDWAKNIEPVSDKKQLVEVRFKNGRKNIFVNEEHLFLKRGDIVAVEAATGHDIGIVSLTGESVYWQLKKYGLTTSSEFPKIYRKARPSDLEKWQNTITKEPQMLLRTKEIIEDMGLKMKLGDVEFQGDGSKATFYYTADDRVDFRELIKVLASEFKIRIEMRQIGARQESARIGGIGTCGQELCCVKWKRNFESVTTNAARFQELSLNPSKLAGQCGKLKCCLNYEVDAYIEARKEFPDTSISLKTKEGNAFFQKSDVFKKILWYSFDVENSVNITALSVERVEEIIEMNKKGEIPDTLLQNNLNLADLISTKHNVQITEEEIVDSKEKLPFKQNKKRKSKKRRKTKNGNGTSNNNHKNQNSKSSKNIKNRTKKR